ncbi:MAG: TadE family protein [Dehalococcoidia bacterium]
MGKLIRKNRTEGEKGQNLVEFAMVVPIFLILVFAIVDFGMGFHAWITVTNAAREGARIGAVGADETTIEDRVRDTTSSIVDDNVTVTINNAQGEPGESVSVDVEYEYEMITPLSNLLSVIGGSGIGSTIDFHSKSEMRLE